jgi:hypothetical protein
VAGIVVFGTEVVDDTVLADNAGPIGLWEDPEDISGTTIKITAVAMIRTIKIPAMILTGTFPVPRDSGGVIGGIIGSSPAEAGG